MDELKIAQTVLHRQVKLYLKESFNQYTLDSITYGKPTLIEPKYNPSFVKYFNGFITLQDKFSPIKITLSTSYIYKWMTWRRSVYLPFRYMYLLKHPSITSPRPNIYLDSNGIDISLHVHKAILNFISTRSKL